MAVITVVKAPFISCTIPRLLQPPEFIIQNPRNYYSYIHVCIYILR